jgi:hypothetical protein
LEGRPTAGQRLADTVRAHLSAGTRSVTAATVDGARVGVDARTTATGCPGPAVAFTRDARLVEAAGDSAHAAVFCIRLCVDALTLALLSASRAPAGTAITRIAGGAREVTSAAMGGARQRIDARPAAFRQVFFAAVQTTRSVAAFLPDPARLSAPAAVRRVGENVRAVIPAKHRVLARLTTSALGTDLARRALVAAVAAIQAVRIRVDASPVAFRPRATRHGAVTTGAQFAFGARAPALTTVRRIDPKVDATIVAARRAPRTDQTARAVCAYLVARTRRVAAAAVLGIRVAIDATIAAANRASDAGHPAHSVRAKLLGFADVVAGATVVRVDHHVHATIAAANRASETTDATFAVRAQFVGVASDVAGPTVLRILFEVYTAAVASLGSFRADARADAPAAVFGPIARRLTSTTMRGIALDIDAAAVTSKRRRRASRGAPSFRADEPSGAGAVAFAAVTRVQVEAHALPFTRCLRSAALLVYATHATHATGATVVEHPDATFAGTCGRGNSRRGAPAPDEPHPERRPNPRPRPHGTGEYASRHAGFKRPERPPAAGLAGSVASARLTSTESVAARGATALVALASTRAPAS